MKCWTCLIKIVCRFLALTWLKVCIKTCLVEKEVTKRQDQGKKSGVRTECFFQKRNRQVEVSEIFMHVFNHLADLQRVVTYPNNILMIGNMYIYIYIHASDSIAKIGNCPIIIHFRPKLISGNCIWRIFSSLATMPSPW